MTAEGPLDSGYSERTMRLWLWMAQVPGEELEQLIH